MPVIAKYMPYILCMPYMYALYVCLICAADTGKSFAEYMLDAIDCAAEHDRAALHEYPLVSECVCACVYVCGMCVHMHIHAL